MKPVLSSASAQQSPNRDLTHLKEGEFDVTIIGGGISGAWLALHCAQAGYRTALIEKHDYAAQTSSSSSKLLHGGIRYLQQMQFFKVRESAMERAHYLYAAPHLSKPVPFAIPTYKDLLRSKLLLRCGMLAYRILCLGERKIIQSSEEALPGSYSLSRSQFDKVCEIGDENHTGAVIFYERHMHNAERTALSIIATARELGAKCYNYVAAKGIHIEDGKVTRVTVEDQKSGECFDINTGLIINAAGPWIDQVTSLARPNTQARISGYAVGSHIITRKLSDYAIALTTQYKSESKIDRGGRHVFVIPWKGHSLIGTSYDEIEAPEEHLQASAAHVDQLLDAINHAMPSAKLKSSDIVSSYSGLYPLRTNNIDSAVYQGSGEYQIVDHASADNIDGMITALGAKFTTARKLSALTMKIVATKLGGSKRVCKLKLDCSDYQSFSEFSSEMVATYSDVMPVETIQHLLRHYGSDFESLMLRIKDHAGLLAPIAENQPDIVGQIVWATEREQALTLEDVLFRRTSVGFLGISTEEIRTAAKVMTAQLGWDSKRSDAEILACVEKIAHTQKVVAAAQA